MSSAAEIQAGYEQECRRVLPTLPGAKAAWVRRLRAEALERFGAMGLPSGREESWRYTDMTRLAARHFRLAPGRRVVGEQLIPHLLGAPVAGRMVFVNGRLAPELSQLADLPPGLTLASLAATLEQAPGALEPHLTLWAPADGLAALNTAFLNDGAYVRLAAGTRLETPVELVYIAAGARGCAVYLRSLIVAEEDSQGTVVETSLTLNEGACLCNAMTEVALARDARLAHYAHRREGAAAHLGGIRVRQGRDSRYASFIFTDGGAWVRNDLALTLDAEGAECTLDGLYLASGHQQVENHTRIEHRKPRGSSRQRYKGVLHGHARGVFDGRVVVHPGAQKTDARQANHNLLLSEGAEADSKPQMEIYADDVKCFHGATVGHLDADALFYLRSRALDEAAARSLLVHAFASDILQAIGLVPLRARLERQLAERFLRV